MNPKIESIKLKENSEPKKITVKGLLLPKDKVSRNGVLYDWETVKQNYEKLPGLPMLYNHQNEGKEKPIGHFTDSYLKEEDDEEGIAGWYYEADINPKSEYADSIVRGDISKVSVQIVAGQQREEKREDVNGDEMSYTRAFISDVLESSAVPTPGFMETTMEVMAESFKVMKGRFKESINYNKLRLHSKWNINGDIYRLNKIINRGGQEIDPEDLEMNIKDGFYKPQDVFLIFQGNGIKKLSLDYIMKAPTKDIYQESGGISTGNIPSQTKIPDRKEEGFGVLAKIVGKVLLKYVGTEIAPVIIEKIAGDVIDMLKRNNALAEELYGKKEYVKPLPESEADPEELSMGIHVELEHTDDKEEAKVIALQHLAEMPDYYTRLKKMEDEGKSKVESWKFIGSSETQGTSWWKSTVTGKEITVGFEDDPNKDNIKESLLSYRLNRLIESFKDNIISKAQQMKKDGKSIADIEKYVSSQVKDSDEIDSVMSYVESVSGRLNYLLKESLKKEAYGIDYYRLQKDCFPGKKGDIIKVNEKGESSVWTNLNQRKMGSPFVEYDIADSITEQEARKILGSRFESVKKEAVDYDRYNDEEIDTEAADRYVCRDCSFSTNDMRKASQHEDDKGHDVRDEQQVRGRE